MRGEWSALGVVQKMVSARVRPGDFCIDATAGNGHDTVFLCRLVGEHGRVLAMDIQEAAVANTRRRLMEEGCGEIATVLKEDHARLSEHAEAGTADAILFNFGWLPGGDHTIFTRPETSLPAVRAALELLRPGGLLSLCLYYGRDNGYAERDALLRFLSTLDSSQFTVLRCDFLNRKNDPPFPVFVIREA